MKEIRNNKESEIRAVAPETRTVEGYAVVLIVFLMIQEDSQR